VTREALGGYGSSWHSATGADGTQGHTTKDRP